MRRVGLFICVIAALWGSCTKEEMPPGSGEPGYSTQRISNETDTIAFDGVWTITLFDDNHNDLTAIFSEMYFFFDRNGQVRVVEHDNDTIMGVWEYRQGAVKADFQLQFPAGSIHGALNGNYKTEIVSDHQFKLTLPPAVLDHPYRSIEFRKRMGI